MGAWDLGNFDNDDAMDWIYELEGVEDLSIIKAALPAVTIDADEYLDATDCSRALAAAEVVAALRGLAAEDLPEAVAAWVPKAPEPLEELAEQAREAAFAVRSGSELRELWEETEEFEAWLAIVEALEERLS